MIEQPKKKTWADYKRAWRQKQREKQKALRDASRPLLHKPFSEFLREDGRSGFADHYLILGQDWWNFDADTGINPLGEDALEEEELQYASNSIGKAELLMSVLEDVTDTLAANINAYKQKEISDRLSELDQKNPENFDEVTRLKRMLITLKKPVRRSIPRWKVTRETIDN